MLYATVRQRKIYVKRPETVIQNGVNVDDLILEMDDEWAAMDTIVAVFTLKYTDEGEKVIAKEMLHTFGNPLRVPWECLTYTGQLFVSCTGYVGGEKVMTTMYPESFWNVVQSGPVTGDTPLEPTPTLYEQILSAYSKANEAAENAENVAKQLLEDKANGVFNGEPGKDGQTPKFTISRFTETGGRGGVDIRLLTPTGENSAEVTQTKLYDGKNGTNGSSPKIGSDGFWYVGSTSTGVKARGDDGDDYVLTDADKQEIAELAAELVDVPGGEGTEKEYTAEFSNTGFIRPNGTPSPSANGRYTNRIPTNGVTKIRGIAGFYVECSTIAFYAADGTALTSLNALGSVFITSGDYYDDGTFELDITDEKYADAAYFVVSSYRTSVQSGVYTYALDFSDDFCEYTKSEEAEEEPRYRISGKTVVFFGDSITSGGYPELIDTITGAAVTNHGVGGATVAAGVADVTHIVEDVAAYTGNHDIVCISGGYNDFCREVPLGALTTGYTAALDTTTLIGALESIFRKLLTSHSEAQIFYVLTHKIDGAENRQNDIGLTLTDYHDAIVRVLEKYSIPFYDAFADSGLITSTASDWGETLRTLYTKNADGTHPNVDGYLKYYVYQIIGLLETGTGSGRTSKVEVPDSYTKAEIDAIMGSYITDIDNLVGGEG